MNENDLKPYKPLPNGRCSSSVIISGAAKNVFRHITSAERQSGIELAVKIFWGISNADNGALLSPSVYQDAPTRGATEYVVQWVSTQRTAADDAALKAEAATATLVGAAKVVADITAGAQSFDIGVKHADQHPGARHDVFKNGYKIKMVSHSTALGTDGFEETLTIDGTPTVVSGNTIRITVMEQIANSYTVGNTRCTSLIIEDEIKPSFTAPSISGSVTWDHNAQPLELDNRGTVEEDLTFTFTDATHFTLTGDTLGNIGSGTTDAEFAPVNPDFSRPYLTLPANAFSGAGAGDTITLTIHPARLPVGELLVVPPASPSLANNLATAMLQGEST